MQKRKAEPISVLLSAAGFAVFSAKDKDYLIVFFRCLCDVFFRRIKKFSLSV